MGHEILMDKLVLYLPAQKSVEKKLNNLMSLQMLLNSFCIFFVVSFCSLVIACCVTHFIVLIIIEQSVQKCDATMLNTYSNVWLIKICIQLFFSSQRFDERYFIFAVRCAIFSEYIMKPNFRLTAIGHWCVPCVDRICFA